MYLAFHYSHATELIITTGDSGFWCFVFALFVDSGCICWPTWICIPTDRSTFSDGKRTQACCHEATVSVHAGAVQTKTKQ